MPILIPELSGNLGDWLFQVSTAITVSKISTSSMYLSNDFEELPNTILSAFPVYSGNKDAFKYFSEPIDLHAHGCLTSCVNISEKSNVVLKGRFMQWKFIPENISRFLAFSKAGEIEKKYESLALTECCFIHDCMGQFKDDPLCNVDLSKYYTRSINFMKSRGHTKFVILSDNLNFLKDNIDGGEIDNVVICETEENSLYLMKRCKAGIMSNSALSWWGGFLNKERDICIPSKWFNSPQYKIGGLYFHGCTVIQV